MEKLRNGKTTIRDFEKLKNRKTEKSNLKKRKIVSEFEKSIF